MRKLTTSTSVPSISKSDHKVHPTNLVPPISTVEQMETGKLFGHALAVFQSLQDRATIEFMISRNDDDRNPVTDVRTEPIHGIHQPSGDIACHDTNVGQGNLALAIQSAELEMQIGKAPQLH
jgi:hypothetical protein